MKYITLGAIIILMASFKIPASNNEDKIIGTWLAADDKNVIVQVFKCGNEYNAKIIWFDDSDDKTKPMATRCDLKNPDKNLRSRKLIGLEVLRGLIYNTDDNKWLDGHIYDPSSGKEYCAKAWLTGDGNLKVRGYWRFEILGQTMGFTKTN
ncbi:MAG: DUF2147 domain-containing protein [Sphingobacteriales bacterium]|nr:DUF2147 domain-containing protein [Sphingobacteriales bacterium]MBI3720471.1 DUF2147 domain-containing protein [Sphingobacteriales bacterium]